MRTKRCSKCREVKSASDFSPDNKTATKLSSRCKRCNSKASVEYAQRNREKVAAYQREWGKRNRAKLNEKYRQLKIEVMGAYGGHCACCGESALVFLAIDHVDDDGAEHRRTEGVGHGHKFYAWLKRQGYPSGFQVLCFNCNWAKSHGGCPHQKGLGDIWEQSHEHT